MRIELERDEAKLLAEVVRERIGEMSGEIHHASISGYRDELRERKSELESLLERLEGTAERVSD